MVVKKKAPASGKATAKIIDFSNVKERGNFNPKHIDSGDYAAVISKVEETESKAGDEMWVFTITLDDVPRATYPHYCVLSDTQYWKIKALFEAAGVNVGKRKVKVDPNRLIGKSIGVGIEDDEYEGRLKSVIVDVFPPDELDDTEGDEEDELEEDEVEEEPAPKRRAKKRPAEPEEDEEEDDDEEEEDEPEPPKKRAAKKAPSRKKKRPVEDEEDEDELEIDEL